MDKYEEAKRKDLDTLRRNMASALGAYFGFKTYRDGCINTMQQLSELGWIWDDNQLCWRKESHANTLQLVL